MKRILVIGAGGQIGTELVPHLQKHYGEDNVIGADLKDEAVAKIGTYARAIKLDALDFNAFGQAVKDNNIDAIFNLVALLSATGEKNPELAWKINMGALVNSLTLAKEFKTAVFTPSSIGAFGVSTPHDNYYFHRFGVDARSVRFPGIISNGCLPGGGTTDYAVEVFYEILKTGHYTCPIPEDSYMDMLYMPDALNAVTQLMEADPSRLKHRNSFNITCMSFCPKELFAKIRERVPSATFDYNVDPVKAAIADSWPNMMDDSCAREEWGWNPQWHLDAMVDDMLKAIAAKLGK